MKFKRDCKEFSGVYSCDTMKYEGYKDCEECKFYEKIGKKILIIKLGAIGDVLRTIPILEALKEKYKNCYITWVVNEESKEVLINNPNVDRILVYNQETILRLKYEKFYAMYNLEIDTPATLLANVVRARKKCGYYFAKDGKTSCFNKNARYYLERAYSDFVNKNNTKSYQEMIFEICELEWKKQDYYLRLEDNEKEYAKRFNLKKPVLGINIGSSERWIAKQWSREKLVEFVYGIKEKYDIILLGGRRERKIKQELAEGLDIKENDSYNSLREFISVIDLCDVIVTGDTMAMHAALALKKKVIGLFFCTPPNEIEGYGRLKKIISPLLDKYFYTDEYSDELANSISANEVIKHINKRENL